MRPGRAATAAETVPALPALQGGGELAEPFDRDRVERVADLVPAATSRHEPSLAQHLQVLADGGLADLEDVGEVAGAGLGLTGELERDPQPDRMAERLQPLGV